MKSRDCGPKVEQMVTVPWYEVTVQALVGGLLLVWV
jgi:hypothetical protein